MGGRFYIWSTSDLARDLTGGEVSNQIILTRMLDFVSTSGGGTTLYTIQLTGKKQRGNNLRTGWLGTLPASHSHNFGENWIFSLKRYQFVGENLGSRRKSAVQIGNT